MPWVTGSDGWQKANGTARRTAKQLMPRIVGHQIQIPKLMPHLAFEITETHQRRLPGSDLKRRNCTLGRRDADLEDPARFRHRAGQPGGIVVGRQEKEEQDWYHRSPNCSRPLDAIRLSGLRASNARMISRALSRSPF